MRGGMAGDRWPADEALGVGGVHRRQDALAGGDHGRSALEVDVCRAEKPESPVEWLPPCLLWARLNPLNGAPPSERVFQDRGGATPVRVSIP